MDDILQVLPYHSSSRLIPSFLLFVEDFQIGVSDSGFDIVNENVISLYQNLNLGVDKQRQIKF